MAANISGVLPSAFRALTSACLSSSSFAMSVRPLVAASAKAVKTSPFLVVHYRTDLLCVSLPSCRAMNYPSGGPSADRPRGRKKIHTGQDGPPGRAVGGKAALQTGLSRPAHERDLP